MTTAPRLIDLVIITRPSTDRGNEADCDAGAREREPMTDEHPLHVAVLGAECDANADLPSSLRHGIRDDAVDSDEPERQRHGTGDGEHDERERSPRHRASANVGERAYL